METNRNLSWLCTMVNETKTNISYPTNKNIRIGDRDYAKQCNVIVNESVLPDICYKTDTRIKDIVFSSDDLHKIIKNLNPNKAHGHDQISIKMIQICG